MKVKLILAGSFCFAAALAHSAPLNYFGVLNEARVIPSAYFESLVDFEIIVEEVTPKAENKTLRISGGDGAQVSLIPGEYYRITDYGDGSARLDYLNPGEKRELFIKRMKWKTKR